MLSFNGLDVTPDLEEVAESLQVTQNYNFFLTDQKWNLQKSASDEGVKIELRPVLAQFRANLSFPALKMLLSGL